MVGCGLPVAALRDPSVAAWVRTHGITVFACGDDELGVVQASGMRPAQVVLRCGPVTETLRGAVALGVTQFIVSTDRHVDVLAACAQEKAMSVCLDDHGPVVIGERRLNVIGIHCDVDDSNGALEWGAVAERLLCRIALMRTCGLPLTRISLAGGSATTWLAGGSQELTTIASAVDDALDEGCARWRLPRPAVTLAPLGA
jgi:diaminopimelate decarboxylase